MTETIGPSAKALEAFRINAEPLRLSGGQGISYRAGNVILKPTDNADETTWTAGVLRDIEPNGFRIARYLESTTGDWVVDGWFAQEFLDGDHSNTRWKDTFDVCKSFHRALLAFSRPAFIEAKHDPWSIADRVAWQELPIVCYPELEQPLEKLFSVIRPVSRPNQVIHGDFTMNVLFADNQPPAVIDFSPYWRPAEFAIAVIVVDALVWQRADPSILDYVEDLAEINQMLVRAEIRRIMEIDGHYRQFGKYGLKDIERHREAIEIICARVR